MAATEPVTPRRMRAIGDSGLVRSGERLLPSAPVGREGLDGLVDRLGQVIPEGPPQELRLATGEQEPLARALGQDIDDRLQVGLKQAGQVLELDGQL